MLRHIFTHPYTYTAMYSDESGDGMGSRCRVSEMRLVSPTHQNAMFAVSSSWFKGMFEQVFDVGGLKSGADWGGRVQCNGEAARRALGAARMRHRESPLPVP